MTFRVRALDGGGIKRSFTAGVLAAQQKDHGVLAWNYIAQSTLNDHATHLKIGRVPPKTLRNELTTLVQTHKWLQTAKHLYGGRTATTNDSQVEKRTCSRRPISNSNVRLSASASPTSAAKVFGWL